MISITARSWLFVHSGHINSSSDPGFAASFPAAELPQSTKIFHLHPFVLVGSTDEGALGYASLLNLYRAGWHQIAV
jgi:hypothetical protein